MTLRLPLLTAALVAFQIAFSSSAFADQPLNFVLPTPTPTAASVSPEQKAFDDCTALVTSHGHFSGVHAPAHELDKRSRIASCVGMKGFRVPAIAYLKQALHVLDSNVTNESVGVDELEKNTDVEESANAQLAILEFQAGQVAAARARIHGYYGNTPLMKTAWNMIDPLGHRRFMAHSAAANRAFEAQFSPDELAVIKKEGMNYREETFDAAGYHEVTWWYGGDVPRVAYTFVNGNLTSVYRP